jgi:WD40 repeat protein
MKDVSCMEWRPNAGAEIAIGSRYGVCLWQNHPKKTNASKDENDRMINDSWWLDYRTVSSYFPVNCLCWSPCGSFLAVGSVNNTSVLVWNANYNSYVEHSFGTGVTCLSWSPNGYYLFAGGLNKCTVWETLNWTSQTWTFSSACQSASWSGESSYLAVAFAEEPTLYFLQFHSIPPIIDAHFIHKSSLHAYTVIKNDKEHRICGKIKEIVWDNTSNRIAVSFQESPLIALFSTGIAPNLKVYPLGYIRGPSVCGMPLVIRFCNAFVRGALLTICWENGKIGFIPLYFLGGHSHDQNETI